MQLLKFSFKHHEYLKKNIRTLLCLLGKQIFFKLEALAIIIGGFRGKRRFIPCCDKEFSCHK